MDTVTYREGVIRGYLINGINDIHNRKIKPGCESIEPVNASDRASEYITEYITELLSNGQASFMSNKLKFVFFHLQTQTCFQIQEQFFNQ